MAKSTTTEVATINSLLAKGNVLVKRGSVWSYPGSPNDRSGTNLVMPLDYVTDAEVQEALASGDLVVAAVDTYGGVAAVKAKPAEGETVRIVNPALAGTAEAGTEMPVNSRPTHDAGRSDVEAEYVVPATAATQKPVEPVKPAPTSAAGPAGQQVTDTIVRPGIPGPRYFPGEASERKPAARQPDDFDPRHASPDWRREPTTQYDPRKGR